MSRLCRLWLTLIHTCVKIVVCVWSWLPHVTTVLTLIDPDWLFCWLLCRLKSTLLCSYIDSVKSNWPLSAHVLALSTVIDPDMLMWGLCRLILTLICPCFFSDEWVRPRYAQVSVPSTEIDPDIRKCRPCRHWLTLIGIKIVVCLWSWLPHVTTVLTLIDPNWLICWLLCRLKSTHLCSYVDSVKSNWPLSAHVLALSTLIDPDMPMFWLCRLKSTLISSCVDSDEWIRTRYAQVSVPSTEIALIYACVDLVDIDWPWLAYMSILLTLFEHD